MTRMTPPERGRNTGRDMFAWAGFALGREFMFLQGRESVQERRESKREHWRETEILGGDRVRGRYRERQRDG